MARVIDSTSYQPIKMASPLWRAVLVGVVSGIIFWVLMSSINQLTDSNNIPGDVSVIITATIATAIMVSFGMTMPLIVSIAVAVTLWGIEHWVDNMFWLEQLAWVVLLYILSYVTYSWITRYKRLTAVIVFILICVVIVRLSLSL